MQSLGGRYYTACDVGTFSADMDDIARECDFVTGRTVAHGGAGDSSVLTAYGVFQGMRAAAEVAWGAPTPRRPHRRRRRRRQGRPPPGRATWSRTAPAVVVTDVNAAARRAGPRGVPRRARRSPSTDALVAEPLDVYAPCALGGALTDEVVEMLSAKIVCGAANNQLAHPGVEKALEERGILYAPDYCVNSGGLIQVADELAAASASSAPSSAPPASTTRRARSSSWPRADGVPPAIAADRLAERRMRDVGRLRGIWLG